ncbi:hypothetical protein NPIL_669381 [Nephila pilipes]|uniref:Uncharacterized protein n=1 Tax=Nephila pilipes TaxID=299642 RepID=A0A8X6TSH1_NEPPI|nr:hypothetical protein NPIL_366131 [Nephila pilipes]GFU62921.1 hypothetical protein NPIL_669381 [Nephila pilipes]
MRECLEVSSEDESSVLVGWICPEYYCVLNIAAGSFYAGHHITKQTIISYPKHSKYKRSDLLLLVHSDLCGPIR